MKRFFATSKAFYLIIIIFLFQALVFTASVGSNISPDESYHYGLIKYYSQQPLSHGPFISHQSAGSFVLGDIQRRPSYLYHYVLGNILRLFAPLLKSETTQIIFLRLINILIVLVALWMFHKLFNELKVSRFKQNIIFLLLVLTTMFIGISAAISYDNAVFLVTGALLLLTVRILKRKSSLDTLAFLTVGCIGILIKSEFLVIFLGTILVLVGNALTHNLSMQVLFKDLVRVAKKQRPALILLSIVLILCLGLVGERYGENIIKYRAITPSCTRLHTQAECNMNRIYRRNLAQKQAFAKFTQEGHKLIYNPFGFAGNWISQMYNSLFFYLGNKSILPTKKIQNLVAIYLLIISVVILIYYKRGFVLQTAEDRGLMFMAIFYISTLLLFNLNSYLNSGDTYGFQGRYLMPALPLVYLFLVKALSSSFRNQAMNKHKLVKPVIVGLSLIVIFNQIPLLVFYRGTNQTWYTNTSRSINIEIQKVLTKTRVAQQGSLPNDTTSD